MNRVRYVFTALLLVSAIALIGCGGKAPAEVPGVVTSTAANQTSATPTAPPAAENHTGPDLILQSVSWTPGEPQPVESVRFNVTVTYQGSQPAELFTITYFIDDAETGSDLIAQLEPGASITESFVRRAPGEEFVVRIEVDSQSKVVEVDEANNIGEVTFSEDIALLTIGGVRQVTCLETPEPLGPDLVISQMSWAPLNPKNGDVVSFNVTMTNQGDQEAAPFTVDYRVDGESKSHSFVPGLAVNASANKTFNWRALGINYRISVLADSEDAVTESDETNNRHEVVFSDKPFDPPPTVTANASGKADLIISDVSYLPQTPLPGETVTFNVIVKNQGTADAEAFAVNWYVTPVDSPQNFYQTFPELGGGNQTLSMSFEWNLRPGDTSLLFVVDQLGTVDEENEDNNKFEVNFANVELSDLKFNKITLSPESVSIGDQITLIADVLNDGQSNVAAFWVSAYLNGKKVRTSRIDGITAGGTANVSLSWPAAAGQHTVETVIDDLDEISERNENNNRETSALPEVLLPDLTVDEIVWSPLNPLLAEACVFTVTVRNAGPGDSGPSQFTFAIDGGVKQSGQVPALAAAETWTATYKWTAETGQHQINASVSYKASPEVNQQNNSLTTEFSHTVPPLPDLVVSALSLTPAAPAAGTTAALHIEVSNYGGAAASSSLLKCYLDDQLLTSITVWTIEVGQASDEVYYFEVTPGVHQIRIVVDAMNNITESNEANNSGQMQFSVSG